MKKLITECISFKAADRPLFRQVKQNLPRRIRDRERQVETLVPWGGQSRHSDDFRSKRIPVFVAFEL